MVFVGAEVEDHPSGKLFALAIAVVFAAVAGTEVGVLQSESFAAAFVALDIAVEGVVAALEPPQPATQTFEPSLPAVHFPSLYHPLLPASYPGYLASTPPRTRSGFGLAAALIHQ